MNVPKSTLALLIALSAFPSARAQELPIARRAFAVSNLFNFVASQAPAATVAGASGSVLVVFRTSVQGTVIDARATGGTPAMQASAQEALSQWKFKPAVFADQPQQLVSAVVFTFVDGSSHAEAAKPMSARDLSPRLQLPCSNALSHKDLSATGLCKQQLDAIEHDKQSSAMEKFSAHDEYGLALLEVAGQPQKALDQFNEAIKIASDQSALKPSEAEWGYVFWHRSVAESRTRDAAGAAQDLATARSSIAQAEGASNRLAGPYYHHLLEEIDAQQASSAGRAPASPPTP